jgi:hypothetical protein
MEHWWNEIGKENQNCRRKIRPSATLSFAKPTRTGTGLNPSLCGEGPTTNRLIHGTPYLFVDELDRIRVEMVIACLKVLAKWIYI